MIDGYVFVVAALVAAIYALTRTDADENSAVDIALVAAIYALTRTLENILVFILYIYTVIC